MSGMFQTALPYDATRPRPLPGIAPLDPAEWLLVDEAFAAQMEERARLLNERRGDVLAVTEAGRPAADALLGFVLAWLGAHGAGYEVGARAVRRPDGVRVPVDRQDPMATLGQLVQEDLCLLEKRGGEHVLTAAVLCFPANWRLAEKIDRPLSTIHGPVAEYDETMARRVQRLFDGVREGRPLWRFNALAYDDPSLYQPEREAGPRGAARTGDQAPYLRSERQCVLRLPKTQATVFSIHTYLLRRSEAGTAPAG